MLNFQFFFTNISLGFGLAMDAFSVSLANGLSDTKMKLSHMHAMALLFGLFQMIMPLIGWFIVTSSYTILPSIQPFIPWVALILLSIIGLNMIKESKQCNNDCLSDKLTFKKLITQAFATSIDALSVGFTIANYTFLPALIACLIIGTITYILCFFGIHIGKKAGTKLASKASLIGGCILIAIGIEIFISNL